MVLRKTLTSIFTVTLVAASLAVGIGTVLAPKKAEAQVNGTRPTLMTTYPVVGRKNGSVILSCRITDLNGNGIAGLQVDGYLLRLASSSRIVTRANTNSDGYASRTVSLSGYQPGTYVVGFSFGGNGSYGASLPVSTLSVTR